MIFPINTSGRTKAEIADAWEYRNSQHLLGLSVHDEECRCLYCFNAKLDGLLSQSEEGITDGSETCLVGSSYDYEL